MKQENFTEESEVFTEAVPPSADPWTIATYVAIEEALRYLNDGVFSKWQAVVSPQLAAIAQTLSQMAEQINQFVPKVERALLARVTTDFRTEIVSHCAALERIAARNRDGEALGDADRSEVSSHKAGVELRLGQLLQHDVYGFAGYAGVMSGLAAMVLAFKLLQTDRATSRAYIGGTVLPYLNSALDRDVSYSLVAGYFTLADRLAGDTAAFESLANTRWRVSDQTMDDPNSDGLRHRIRQRAWRICTFTGAVGSAAVGIGTEDHDWVTYSPGYPGSNPSESWMPGLPERYDWGDRDKGRDVAASIVRDRLAAANAGQAAVNAIRTRVLDAQNCRDRLRAEVGA